MTATLPIRPVSLVAATAWGVLVVAAALDLRLTAQAYLTGYLYVLGAPLGALAFTMIHHLTGGRWGRAIHVPLQLSIATIPLIALLAAPLLAGVHLLYPWAQSDSHAATNHAYLNVPFFLVRGGCYLLVWCALGWLLSRWASTPVRARRLSAAGLILLVLTVTFAAMDWGMSLDPHWYSTIYGLMFLMNQALVALCLCTLAALGLPRSAPGTAPPDDDALHDLGNLLLALVSLWAYLAFMQYLIIWSANLPEEVVWYVPRTRGAWGVVAVSLIVFHFALPFVLLLNRRMKRSARPLAAIAALLLAVHLLNMWWLLVPSFPRAGHALGWREPVAALAIGGLWLTGGLWLLRRRGAAGGGT